MVVHKYHYMPLTRTQGISLLRFPFFVVLNFYVGAKSQQDLPKEFFTKSINLLTRLGANADVQGV